MINIKNKNEFFLKQKKKLNKFKNIKYAVIIIVFSVLFFIRNKKFHGNLNNIHIAMSLNDNYTYPIMVSITSILLNSNKNTYIEFHLLIGKDVKAKNKKKITSLKRLNHNIKFSFHHVGNFFNGWIHGKKKLTVASFYRSIVAELIKNIDKIIYLDGDTLTYGDLSEMYQLNMDNFYFRGVREILPRGVEAKIDRSRFICAGVMLMNLKLMRKDNIFNTFKKYYLNSLLILMDYYLVVEK
jgi:lipopolysaccharide biosynthesis glycosyltransferase